MSKEDLWLVNFLGASIGEMLVVPPFSAWAFSRSIEADLPTAEVWYEFAESGVEVVCDESERIRTIFLHRGEGEVVVGVPFSLSRRAVLERFGTPERSGAAVRIPVLGDRGAWDRFRLPAAALHIEYLLDRDEIGMITLMRPDAVP